MQEEEDSKRKEAERERRTQRKKRDGFQVFLDELHSAGKLTSTSLWKELYSTITDDHRYHGMLGQPGKTTF